MALDAVSFMRARVRGTPSWPGHDPETGYVGADRSDHSHKLLADGAGHTFDFKSKLQPLARFLKKEVAQHRRVALDDCIGSINFRHEAVEGLLTHPLRPETWRVALNRLVTRADQPGCRCWLQH